MAAPAAAAAAVVGALLDDDAKLLRALVLTHDSSAVADTLMARVDASPEALISALAEPTAITSALQMIESEYPDPGEPSSVGDAVAGARLDDDAKLLRVLAVEDDSSAVEDALMHNFSYS